MSGESLYHIGFGQNDLGSTPPTIMRSLLLYMQQKTVIKVAKLPSLAKFYLPPVFLSTLHLNFNFLFSKYR